MINENYKEEIKNLKHDLREILKRKFIDYDKVIKFILFLNKKFKKWIKIELNRYILEVEIKFKNENCVVGYTSVDFINIIWKYFHKKIFDFFASNQREKYIETKKLYDNCIKEKKLGRFKIETVESKKFKQKFFGIIKTICSFYIDIFKYFSTSFYRGIIPEKIIRYFELTISEKAKKPINKSIQAYVLLSIHTCLLILGDILKNKSIVYISYLRPFTSKRNFITHIEINDYKQIKKLEVYFYKSFQHYNFCTLILPTLYEPYLNIGIIHQINNDYLNAVLFFLKSHFRRIKNSRLSINNLMELIKKISTLNQIDLMKFNNLNVKNKKQNLNNLFINLLCTYCFNNTEYFTKSIKSLSNKKTIFFNQISANFCDYIQINKTNFFYINQLIILFCFFELTEKNGSIDSSYYNSFIINFLEIILQLVHLNFDRINLEVVLMILRIILNFSNENNRFFKIFHQNKNCIVNLSLNLNSIFNFYLSKNFKSDSNLNYLKIKNVLLLNTKPKRNYFFNDDVMIRDLSIINYHFKDFDDNHLFDSNDVNLLTGDYSLLIVNGNPSFLSKEQQLKIENLLESSDKKQKKIIECEINLQIKNYENNLRIEAILLLGKKTMEHNLFNINFDFETLNYFLD